jgi:hypothetical protein
MASSELVAGYHLFAYLLHHDPTTTIHRAAKKCVYMLPISFLMYVMLLRDSKYEFSQVASRKVCARCPGPILAVHRREAELASRIFAAGSSRQKYWGLALCY